MANNDNTETLNEEAPVATDFTAQDLNGRTVRLSDFQDFRTVVLVFNRGFL